MMRSRPQILLLAAAMVGVLGLVAPLVAGRLAKEHVRDGKAVRQAFVPVVKDVRRSVVRVNRHGEQRALGVIVSTDGYVLTKASTLGKNPTCSFRGSRSYPARIVHRNEELDLALLKLDLERRKFRPIEFAEAELITGQWVVAPGTGEEPLAVGVVGGPPLRVDHQSGILGVTLDDTKNGPRITRVFPRSAARRAKLEPGDLITHVDDEPIASRKDLVAKIQAQDAGARLKLTVEREEKSITIRVTLGARSPVPNGNHNTREFSERRYGFRSAFEHDAMLTADECGGLLVNLRGKPIGITIARASRTGCYALPAEVVAEYLQERIGDRATSEE